MRTSGGLIDSSFAKTLHAGSRVNFAVRLSWLLDLGKSRAFTGRTYGFRYNFTGVFHNEQTLGFNFCTANQCACGETAADSSLVVHGMPPIRSHPRQISNCPAGDNGQF
jgi:hypothetical protein